MTFDATINAIVCEQCSKRGPCAFNKPSAMARALERGWGFMTIRIPGEQIRHFFCPRCRPDWPCEPGNDKIEA